MCCVKLPVDTSLVSRPEFAPYIRRLFQIKKSNRLSKALLETLAVIAYKQPVTRSEVEAHTRRECFVRF